MVQTRPEAFDSLRPPKHPVDMLVYLENKGDRVLSLHDWSEFTYDIEAILSNHVHTWRTNCGSCGRSPEQAYAFVFVIDEEDIETMREEIETHAKLYNGYLNVSRLSPITIKEQQ